MQALGIRIRDVYVSDITVNFMLNKRKSKKAAGASPQTPLGELSAFPQTPLLSREGARPLPYPPPSCEYIYQTPPFLKSWIRPLYVHCMNDKAAYVTWMQKEEMIKKSAQRSLSLLFISPELLLLNLQRNAEKWPIHRRSSCFLFQIELTYCFEIA